MDYMKNILAVSWLTPKCSKTIQVGISLSAKYQAELSVVHVMDTTWLKGWSIPMVSMEEERKREMEKNQEDLHNIISIENKKDMIIKEFVREGTPSEVILKLIEEENIDLLILRSQEESRLERLLVGGSNDEIIRAMPCSIFLVKQEPYVLDDNEEVNDE
ncbi:MAG: universal stress protein [Smithellaceae bacterium]|nr:universal stress protein [Smithellaceae bacterium]